MTRIICVGNLVHDEVFHVDSLPASGIKTGVLSYHSRFGGPAATAALAICRFGGSAS
jgi:sulfofructose kinase